MTNDAQTRFRRFWTTTTRPYLRRAPKQRSTALYFRNFIETQL